METQLFQTERSDWYFVISASLVFFSALGVTLWDFLVLREMVFLFDLVNVFGLVLFLVGVSIRLVAKRTLGKYYSYGLRTLRGHKIVKHGIYKYVRHPISLAVIIYGIAIPIFFESLYGFLLILGLVPCIIYRIRIEERMLVEEFGDEYREYMKKTKKMIPKVY